MKVIRTLKITADEFFDQLEEGLCQEIAQAVGRDVDASVLQAGFEFVKEPDRPTLKTTVTILEYDRGRCYALRSDSVGDTVEVRYDVEPAADGERITVTFTEDAESFRLKKKGIGKSLTEALTLSHMAQSLLDLEQKVLDIRAGVVAKPQAQPKSALDPLAKKLQQKAEERDAKEQAKK